MKKSRAIQLVLITSLLASCNRHQYGDLESEYDKDYNLYSDTLNVDSNIAYYDPNVQLWWSSFQPYILWYDGRFNYASAFINQSNQDVVLGATFGGKGILRGGFGGRHFSISS